MTALPILFGASVVTTGGAEVRLKERPHGSGFYTSTFLSDGVTVVSSGSAYVGRAPQWASLKLWNARSGQIKDVLVGHENTIRSVIVHPRAWVAVTTDRSAEIRIWNLRTGESRGFFVTNASYAYALHLSPDASIVYLDVGTNAVESRRISDGAFLGRIQLEHWATYRTTWKGCHPEALSADGTTFLSFATKEVLFHDVKTGRLLAKIDGGNADVNDIAYHPIKPIIAVADDSGEVQFWNTVERKLVWTYRHPESLAISALAFSPDGKRLALATAPIARGASHRYADENSALLLVDAEKPQPGEGHRMFGYGVTPIERLAFSPDGHVIVSVDQDGAAKLWVQNPATANTPGGWHRVTPLIASAPGSIKFLTCSPDGQRVAFGGTNGVVKMLHLRDGSIHGLEWHGVHSLSGLKFDKTGQLVGLYKDKVCWWNPVTGEIQAKTVFDRGGDYWYTHANSIENGGNWSEEAPQLLLNYFANNYSGLAISNHSRPADSFWRLQTKPLRELIDLRRIELLVQCLIKDFTK